MNGNKQVFCTVFTPTYNRKDLLMRLYQSLCGQSDKDFEWLIVDDGSVDGTEDMVRNFPKSDFKIIYHKTENGGKHRAINYGLDFANGEVFAIVDSDDYLVADAIAVLKNRFQSISGIEKKFAGVAALKCFNKNSDVGMTFKGEFIDAKSTERRKYNIEGDKFEVFFTEILKKNRFPEIENEKFMTEAILWTRIAKQGYYIRWYNDKLYICDYLEGGLTDSRERLIESSPKGYALYIREQVLWGDITFKQKLGYYSFYYKIRKRHVSAGQIAKELNTNIFMLYTGYCMRLVIEWKRNLK